MRGAPNQGHPMGVTFWNLPSWEARLNRVVVGLLRKPLLPVPLHSESDSYSTISWPEVQDPALTLLRLNFPICKMG